MTPFARLLRTIRTRIVAGFAVLILLQAGVAVAVWQAENGVETATQADAAAEAASLRAIDVRRAMHLVRTDLSDYVRTNDAADQQKVERGLARLVEAGNRLGDGDLANLAGAVETIRSRLEAVVAASLTRRHRAGALWGAAALAENGLAALAQAVTKAPDRSTVEAAAVAIATALHPLSFAQRYSFSDDAGDAAIVRSSVADIVGALQGLVHDGPTVTPRIERLVGTATADLRALDLATQATGEATAARAARLQEVKVAAEALSGAIADLNEHIGVERRSRRAETISARQWVRVTVAGAASIAVLIGLGLATLLVASIMRAARQQQATQSFLDTVLENVPAPIFVKDARDLSYVHVNRAAEVFHGAPRDTLLSVPTKDVLPAVTASSVMTRDREVLAAGGTAVDENVVLETAGNGRRLVTATRCVIPGPNGQPEYLLNMYEDVTERREAEQRIAHMAHFDALTDLPNRLLFADRLTQAMADTRRSDTCLAVLCLDLDHFKEVNDTLGHAAGDLLLRSAASRMSGCLRGGNTIARIGGDEFVALQGNVRGVRDAELLAGRLIEAIRKPFDLEGQRVFIGLSIGIALSAPNVGPTELVKRADTALYEAKQGGRGTFRCFVPEMDERVQQRRSLENDLRAAVGTDQLTLHYQPQVELGSGRIVGAEALMRWHRPGHGDVSPAIFIPLAEDTGLIGPLGVWLLEVACAEVARWPSQLHIAVNVSPMQLRLPGFTDSVKAALASARLDPARLELEVTEGVLVKDTNEARSIFGELRTLGVRLALDDFGTGYASLSYLQQFDFDVVKIDRCFIKDMEPGTSASAITRAIIGLAHSLGIRTVAEGVESQHETEQLQAMGCMVAQGYCFWRPMTGEAMRNLVLTAAVSP